MPVKAIAGDLELTRSRAGAIPIAILTVGFASFISQIKTETDFSKFLDVNEPARLATERAEATYGSQEWILVLLQNPETIFKTATLSKIQEAGSAHPAGDCPVGVFTALGMFAEMVLSFTLIPAALALLPLPKMPEKFDRGVTTRALLVLARFVARRRVAVSVAALVALVLFLWQIPKIRAETSATDFLGRQNSAVRAMEIADESLGGSSEMLIEVDTEKPDRLKHPTLLKRLVALQDYLEAQPEVGRAISIAEVVRTMNQKFNSDDPAFFTVPDDPRLAAQLLTLFTFQGGSLDNLATTDFSKGEVVGRLQR